MKSAEKECKGPVMKSTTSEGIHGRPHYSNNSHGPDQMASRRTGEANKVGENEVQRQEIA